MASRKYRNPLLNAQGTLTQRQPKSARMAQPQRDLQRRFEAQSATHLINTAQDLEAQRNAAVNRQGSAAGRSVANRQHDQRFANTFQSPAARAPDAESARLGYLRRYAGSGDINNWGSDYGERIQAARNAPSFETVRPLLEQSIEGRALAAESDRMFQEWQENFEVAKARHGVDSFESESAFSVFARSVPGSDQFIQDRIEGYIQDNLPRRIREEKEVERQEMIQYQKMGKLTKQTNEATEAKLPPGYMMVPTGEFGGYDEDGNTVAKMVAAIDPVYQEQEDIRKESEANERKMAREITTAQVNNQGVADYLAFRGIDIHDKTAAGLAEFDKHVHVTADAGGNPIWEIRDTDSDVTNAQSKRMTDIEMALETGTFNDTILNDRTRAILERELRRLQKVMGEGSSR